MNRVASTLRSAGFSHDARNALYNSCICTPYSLDPENSDALNTLNIFKRCFIFVKGVRRFPKVISISTCVLLSYDAFYLT